MPFKLFKGVYELPKNTTEVQPLRIHVGCGYNIKTGWHNVDKFQFPGIDQVLDITKLWPFKNVELVFGEHFFQELSPMEAINFLIDSGNALAQNGRIRISTGNLDWIIRSHWVQGAEVDSTFNLNRAFHGWHNKFLWSKELICHVLNSIGATQISFHDYGESYDSRLLSLEDHPEAAPLADGTKQMLIFEFSKKSDLKLPKELHNLFEEKYLKFTRLY